MAELTFLLLSFLFFFQPNKGNNVWLSFPVGVLNDAFEQGAPEVLLPLFVVILLFIVI